MRKINLAITFLCATCISVQAQNTNKENNIHLTNTMFSELLVLQINSDQPVSTDYKIKIYNSQHQELKVETLLVKKSDTEMKVNIADLPFGKYSCTVTKEGVELFSESFVKDAVDPL